MDQRLESLVRCEKRLESLVNGNFANARTIQLCQDLEEERIDFTRNALWSYVNALSLLCVKDDEVRNQPTWAIPLS